LEHRTEYGIQSDALVLGRSSDDVQLRPLGLLKELHRVDQRLGYAAQQRNARDAPGHDEAKGAGRSAIVTLHDDLLGTFSSEADVGFEELNAARTMA
jgi:hypothetical protein